MANASNMTFVHEFRLPAEHDCSGTSRYVRASTCEPGALDAPQLGRLLSRDGGIGQDLSIEGFISAVGFDVSETQLLE